MDCKHISHIKDVIMHGKNLLLPHRKENIGMSELMRMQVNRPQVCRQK